MSATGYTYFKGRQMTRYGMANTYGVRRYRMPYNRGVMTVLGTRRPTVVMPTTVRGGRYGRYASSRRGNYINFYRSQRTDPLYPRPEVKYFTNVYNTVDPIAQTGEISVLNALAQGTGSNQRIGSQFSTKSVYWQYILTLGGTAVPCVGRVLLCWDRQPDSGIAAVADILDISGSNLPVTAPINLSNRDRFVVLSDERHTLSPNGDQIKTITGFRNINQQTTVSTSSTGAAIPTTGALLVLTCSDQSASASEMQLYGTWRVRFIDN